MSGNYTVTQRSSTPSAFAEFGSLTIGSDPVIWINADGDSSALVHVADTLINNGTIIMQSTGPAGSAASPRLIVDSGSLENSGVIDLLPGQGDRYAIYSSIINEGEFNQAAPLDYSGIFVNRHIVNIEG